MGWPGTWREVAGAAADALMARGRTADGDWIYAFGPDGPALDGRQDLYTQAFAMFVLAHAGADLARGDLTDAARTTRTRLTDAWRIRPGFHRGELHPGVRRQNPPRLFEAALALAEIDNAGRRRGAWRMNFGTCSCAGSPSPTVACWVLAPGGPPGRRAGACLRARARVQWSWLAVGAWSRGSGGFRPDSSTARGGRAFPPWALR